MRWSNLIVGFHALHSVAKDYVNAVNAIANIFEPILPTNIIKNMTIMNQSSIKQGLRVFGKRGEAAI